MAWESLGVVSVGKEWASFPVDIIGSDAIRLTHTTPLPNNYCIGHLAQFFPAPAPGGRASPWRRIYSSPSSTILNLSIPDSFKDVGIVLYTLQVKAASYYYLVPWQIEAQAYYP
jgi:hypothetical protein